MGVAFHAAMATPRSAELPVASASPARTSRPAPTARPGVRDQILEAALAEFAGKGFQEASLAAIARRLGVTAPLVLYHFGSKANLWRSALEVFCADLSAVVDEADRDGRALEGRDALRLLVRRLVQFFATNRAAYRLLRDEGGEEDGPSEGFTSKSLRPVIARIEVVYRRAVDEGAVRPAPFETTLFMILGAASCYLESRVLAARLFGSSREDEHWVEDYAEQVVGLCFDGLSAAPRRIDAPRPALAALRAASRSAATSTTATTLAREAALA
ncbi:MAG: TetR/AcrR family transcriptional regulator [Candidatus Binatia bacterium]